MILKELIKNKCVSNNAEICSLIKSKTTKVFVIGIILGLIITGGIGTTTSFNISSIVGVENVGKYSASDFRIVPNIMSWQSGRRGWVVNDTDSTNVTFSKQRDYSISYNNTTGGTFEVAPKVYLYVMN